MDKKDTQIIQELSSNARISIKQLAKKIRLSESSTIYRLNRLKKRQILLGTNTIINTYKLGFEGFRATIILKQSTSETEKIIIEWLIKQKRVSVLGTTKNNEELFLMSWVKSTKEFYSVIQEFKQKFREFIKELQITPYIGTIYYSRQYLNLESEKKEIVVKSQKKESFDNLDLTILNELAYDARQSALSISQKLNKPVKTIINRIRNLEKKSIIAGYGVNIDIKQLGFEYYKLNIIFSKSVNYNKLLSFAKLLPNTIYVDETISQFDFELNVEVENNDQLNNIINELKKLGQGFEYIEIKQLNKYFKLGSLS